MKSFRNFIISEEVDLTANVERGVMDVHDHAVRNNINSFLNGELACNVVTPYVAFNKVNKVLANFHIFLPKAPYMEDEQGVHVFNIKQFGKVAGMRNDGSVVTRIEQPYHLYFEWKRNERGMYRVFAEVVTEEELADLIDSASEDVMDTDDYRDEKIYEEKEEKEIKKAYKAASKNADDSKVGAHLKAAAKAVKKKLESGKKIDEMWGDKVPKSERPGYSKDPSDGKWKPTQKIKKKI